MLVLSRKVHEQIRIGENITLTVLKTQGKSVRIGIDAPDSVRIVRGELPPREPTPKADSPSRRGIPNKDARSLGAESTC